MMSVELRTLTENDSLADARALMLDHGIHHILVVDDAADLVGLVTHRDVLAVTESRLSDALLAQNPSEIRIAEFMTRDVAIIDGRANLREAALYLQRHHYGCLPVVQDGRLLGIITDTDFVGIAIDLLEQLEIAEPEDI
jgi:CBS domain-containing protein